MSDTPIWPTYLVAPHESIHALGVVSINFARFEYAIGWVLSAVSGLSDDFARMTLARMGATPCLHLIEQIVASRKWDENAGPLLDHFLKAAKTLTENRNMLIHANFVHGINRMTTVYRIPKQGKLTQFDMNLDQIRQVADELNYYFYFGQNLANAISVNVHNTSQQEGLSAHVTWPDKPPLPILIRTVGAQQT